MGDLQEQTVCHNYPVCWRIGDYDTGVTDRQQRDALAAIQKTKNRIGAITRHLYLYDIVLIAYDPDGHGGKHGW